MPGIPPTGHDMYGAFWVSFWAALYSGILYSIFTGLLVGLVVWRVQQRSQDNQTRKELEREVALLTGKLRSTLGLPRTVSIDSPLVAIPEHIRGIASLLSDSPVDMWISYLAGQRDLFRLILQFQADHTAFLAAGRHFHSALRAAVRAHYSATGVPGVNDGRLISLCLALSLGFRTLDVAKWIDVDAQHAETFERAALQVLEDSQVRDSCRSYVAARKLILDAGENLESRLSPHASLGEREKA